MSFDDVVEIVKPDQRSQFRLCWCEKCETDENMAYLKCCGPDGSTVWRVKCLGCGRQTPNRPTKHDAQIHWNGVLWKAPDLPPKRRTK